MIISLNLFIMRGSCFKLNNWMIKSGKENSINPDLHRGLDKLMFAA